MSTERDALVGLVALWEAVFDEEHRCVCKDRTAFADRQVPLLDAIALAAAPPTSKCAYCVARETLDSGRLAMDAQLVGRT